MSRQTKTMAAAETVASVGVGFAVSLVLVGVVLPAYGYQVTLQQNLEITAIFTVASIVRSYVMRRVFDHLQHRGRA
jgi:uncharacterized membrane protein